MDLHFKDGHGAQKNNYDVSESGDSRDFASHLSFPFQ
jgi:hypothetical protein